nr:hypothetical protein BgiMline_015617 [Biomphalaria glabrata]
MLFIQLLYISIFIWKGVAASYIYLNEILPNCKACIQEDSKVTIKGTFQHEPKFDPAIGLTVLHVEMLNTSGFSHYQLERTLEDRPWHFKCQIIMVRCLVEKNIACNCKKLSRPNMYEIWFTIKPLSKYFDTRLRVNYALRDLVTLNYKTVGMSNEFEINTVMFSKNYYKIVKTTPRPPPLVDYSVFDFWYGYSRSSSECLLASVGILVISTCLGFEIAQSH